MLPIRKVGRFRCHLADGYALSSNFGRIKPFVSATVKMVIEVIALTVTVQMVIEVITYCCLWGIFLISRKSFPSLFVINNH